MTPDTINTAVFNAIWSLSHRSGLLDAVGILFAEYLPYFMAIGAIFFVLQWPGQRKRAIVFIEAVLAVILARGIIVELLHFFYHHPRPFAALGFDPIITESGWSFPSGHASAYFALATIIFVFHREWGAWYYLLATTNAVARIYVGVHWPLDIVGGVVTGIVSALLVHRLLKNNRETIVNNEIEKVLSA